jgi:hypothetical protein
LNNKSDFFTTYTMLFGMTVENISYWKSHIIDHFLPELSVAHYAIRVLELFMNISDGVLCLLSFDCEL